MLGSNATVNASLKSVASQVRASFAIADASGNPEDILKMFETYERCLSDMRHNYVRDTEFYRAVESNPYVTDYSYGHFLALVKARFEQCATLDEREMVRLKYYVYIGPADVESKDWKPMIDTLRLQVSEDSPFLERLMSVLTFGHYKRSGVVRPLRVEKDVSELPAPAEHSAV